MKLVKFHPNHFGRHGFTRHPSLTKRKKSINIAEIEERLGEFVENGVAKKKKDTIQVDLTSIGVEKLLGKGNVRSKMTIIVPEASKKAEAKISEAGGAVQTTQEEVEALQEEEE